MANGLRITDGSQTRPYQRHVALRPPFSVKGAGIYAIMNRSNSKIYIGSSVGLNHRWAEHRMELTTGKHGNRYLQRAFTQDPEAFYLEVIEQLDRPTKEQLLGREQFWMDFYRSWLPENGYNMAPKAESCQGITRSPEFLAKVSASLKGRKMSPERRLAHSLAVRGHKGRKFTPEQREEVRQRMLRQPFNHEAEAKRRRTLALRDSPPRSKSVLQFSLEGKFIHKFKSINDAERTFGRRSNIHQACKGKRREALGFMWKYAAASTPVDIDPVLPRKPKGPHRRKVNG